MLLLSLLLPIPLIVALPISKPMDQIVNILVNAVDFMETLGNQSFSVFKSKWLQHPEYLANIEQQGPLTIFVPTDEAWFKLPINVWENKNRTLELLKYHVITSTLVFKSVSVDYDTAYKTLTNDTLLAGRFNNTLRVLSGKQTVGKAVGIDVLIRKVSFVAIDTVLELPLDLSRELLPYEFSRNRSLNVDSALEFSSPFTLFLPPNGYFTAIEQQVCANNSTFKLSDIQYLIKALSVNEKFIVPTDFYESSFTDTTIKTIGNYTIKFDYLGNITRFSVNGDFKGNITVANTVVRGGIFHYLSNFTFPGLKKQDFDCFKPASL